MVKWPGKIDAGQTNDAFLTSLELFPMMVAAAGLELPKDVIYDGFDMLPVLQGKTDAERTEMFWEFRGDQAARVGDWKWVQSAKGNGLFDLKQDIESKMICHWRSLKFWKNLSGSFQNGKRRWKMQHQEVLLRIFNPGYVIGFLCLWVG